jgi:seryl-tRNA synthetase
LLDINLIRDNPDKVKKACQDKNVDGKLVDQLLKVDKRRRTRIKLIEEKRRNLNKTANSIGKEKDDKQRIKLIAGAKRVKKEIKNLTPQLKKDEKEFEKLLDEIPNPPAADVKIGKDESENEVIKTWGQKPNLDITIYDRGLLYQGLDLIDVKRAAKVSGTRFGYLKNEAVLLEFALIQYGLELLIKEGFIPVIPPVLTQLSVFHKLGYSQHGGNEDYYLVYDPKKENPQEEANYYLIGTAEHALVPMHKDEIFNLKDLPRRYVGFSSAFRREAGSYGKDTRGIFRVHQFDKLEMVSFIEPQPASDEKEHKYLLSLEERIVQGLGLPYQIVKMCSGDLGHPAARKYDIECWFPSENRYRETHSCSTCTDYQSRALNIKYHRQESKTDFVHVLNGTAIAMGRMILALLENYQQKDGSIKIPGILQKYVGREVISRS